MLKIKDNVDLKELEKFGFTVCGTWYQKYSGDDLCGIRCGDGIITIYTHGLSCTRGLADLFDLIQAGLVEKVCDND